MKCYYLVNVLLFSFGDMKIFFKSLKFFNSARFFKIKFELFFDNLWKVSCFADQVFNHVENFDVYTEYHYYFEKGKVVLFLP